MTVGIDAIDFYTPQTYLPIELLADARQIEYAKLNKGLGLSGMAVCDVNEDVATMGANAAIKIIEREKLDLNQIERIYLGTESALDAAKPTASYISQIIEEHFKQPRGLQNCDVLDMTFACVGGIDALHNCLDWIRLNPSKKAIVIAADNAKYELSSGGEYTQGAGAVAMLLTSNPSILAIDPEIGVATESVGDFFKPRRTEHVGDLFKRAAQILGQDISETDLKQLLENNNDQFWSQQNQEIEIHKDEPVFDGQFSNECYTARITEAFDHYKSQREVDAIQDWTQLIFHLPYAYQGRRMLTPMWIDWMVAKGEINKLEDEIGESLPNKAENAYSTFVKAASKTNLYKTFVTTHIEKGERASSQIGNMYTASIFMSLLSFLSAAAEENQELAQNSIGFFSYGSGSKSKVFSGEVQEKWKSKIEHCRLFETLSQRTAIDFETYEALHNTKFTTPILSKNKPALKAIQNAKNKEGYRTYSV
jgi:hydroxymethylglutaryl-CoA synthase